MKKETTHIELKGH